MLTGCSHFRFSRLSVHMHWASNSPLGESFRLLCFVGASRHIASLQVSTNFELLDNSGLHYYPCPHHSMIFFDIPYLIIPIYIYHYTLSISISLTASCCPLVLWQLQESWELGDFKKFWDRRVQRFRLAFVEICCTDLPCLYHLKWLQDQKPT